MSALYRRILLVVDLTEDSLSVGRRAQGLAATLNAAVELLHVVEFVPVEPMGETLMPSVQIEEELLARARARLAALAATLGLEGAPCHVESGTVKDGNRARRARASGGPHHSRQPRTARAVDPVEFHRGQRAARGAVRRAGDATGARLKSWRPLNT